MTFLAVMLAWGALGEIWQSLHDDVMALRSPGLLKFSSLTGNTD
jgi:hypothetical protein